MKEEKLPAYKSAFSMIILDIDTMMIVLMVDDYVMTTMRLFTHHSLIWKNLLDVAIEKRHNDGLSVLTDFFLGSIGK